MNICPKVITIRRKKKDEGDIETEQFPIEPTNNSIASMLEIKRINCVIFRYGAPVHGMDDIRHWQKQLNNAIKKTKDLSLLYKMEGKIKHIPTFLKNINLTISKNIPLENINVS
jgi:hypothetical protein